MRKKLLFLTLAVVMLLAVLTVSASAMDQLDVYLNGSYEGARTGTPGITETNPFVSYRDFIAWLRNGSDAPNQATYGEIVKITDYLSSELKANWPTRVVVHVTGDSKDNLNDYTSNVFAGFGTITSPSKINGKRVTIRLQGEPSENGGNNPTFTFGYAASSTGSFYSYRKMLDNMEFANLNVNVAAKKADDTKSNYLTTLYLCGASLKIEDTCTFTALNSKGSEQPFSIYCGDATDGTSTTSFTPLTGANLTIEGGTFQSITAATSIFEKSEININLTNVTLKGTLALGGNSTWYKGDASSKNNVTLTANGCTFDGSIFMGYSGLIKYNEKKDVDYSIYNVDTDAWLNLTASFTDCTVNGTAYNIGGYGLSNASNTKDTPATVYDRALTMHGDFDVTYTGCTFNNVVYGVYANSDNKDVTIDGSVDFKLDSCTVTKGGNLTLLYYPTVTGNVNFTIKDTDMLAVVNSKGDSYTGGGTNIASWGWVKGDLTAAFEGCTFTESVYELSNTAKIDGTLETTFTGCTFTKNSVKIPGSEIKYHGARFYFYNGSSGSSVGKDLIATFDDCDVWIDFSLSGKDASIGGDIVTNFTGTSKVGQYYVGGTNGKTLTVNSVITNVDLDDGGYISLCDMGGYGAEGKTNKLIVNTKNVLNLVNGKIEKFYFAFPSDKGTSDVNKAALNVTGGIISDFYGVYNGTGTASAGETSVTQSGGTIICNTVPDAFYQAHTLTKTGGSFGYTVSDVETIYTVYNAIVDEKSDPRSPDMIATANISVKYNNTNNRFRGVNTSDGSFKSEATINMENGTVLDLNGYTLTTDNFYFEMPIINGEVQLGVRSCGVFNNAISDAKTFKYLDLIPKITMLSGHFNEGSGSTYNLTVPAGKVFTITSSYKAMVLKSLTLEPGAVLTAFDKIYASDGVTVQCETLDDLTKAMPPLVASYESSKKGTLTGGVDHIDYVLTADITTTEDFEVPTGAVLDLNGKTLSCKSIEATTGKVIDTVGGGKLVVSDDIENSLAGDNDGYLPLFDGTGYQFYKIDLIQRCDPEMEGDKLSCGFRFTFTNADAYKILASGNSGLKLNFSVFAGGEKKCYVLTDTTIQSYGAAYAEEGDYAIFALLPDYASAEGAFTEFTLNTAAGVSVAAKQHEQN